MLIYIGGIPGVGKTSVIKKAMKLAEQSDLRIKYIAGSKVMCKLAGVKTVKQLRELPEEIRKKLRPELNKIIYAEDRLDFQTIRLCDGHFVFFDFSGEKYGIRQIQPWDRKQLRAFVVILGNPMAVLWRRIGNKDIRIDRKLDYHFIQEEQFLEIHHALEQSEFLDIPLRLIMNNDNSMDTCASLLLKIIKNYCI